MMTLVRIFPQRPVPYEGADMPASSAWAGDAEARLREIVKAQQAHIKWLSEELDRTRSLVYQVVGE